MSNKPAGIFMWMAIMVMCVCVVSVPTSAAGNPFALDAVTGINTPILTAVGLSEEYNVNVSSTRGGSVVTSGDSVAVGRSVTITIKPDAGYTTASVFVISESGEQIMLESRNGALSFFMPDQDVTVDVSFQLKRLA